MTEEENKILVHEFKNKFIWGVGIRYAILALVLGLFFIAYYSGIAAGPFLGLFLFLGAYNLTAHLIFYLKKQFNLWLIVVLISFFQLFDILAITALIYFTGWLESPYWFLYLILIIISGFGIFSRYSLIVFLIALFSAVLYLGLLSSAYLGLIPMYGAMLNVSPQIILQSIINRAIFTLTSFFLFASTIYYFSKLLTQNQEVLSQKNVELLTALNELKDIDRTKNEFISTASHELRTPLAVIRENDSLICDGLAGEINEKQKKLLVTSLGNIDHLSKILDDLLDISKIETQSLELHRSVAKISYLATEAVALLKGRAEQKNISIETRLAPRARTWADAEKILRVFINLLDNAIKFTPANGNILVLVEEIDGEIRANVEDNGVGIAEKDIPLLFQRFVRLGDVQTTRGTGLGLSICKGIIEMHNGRIWAESKLGVGTKITFTLPRVEASE